VAFFFSHASRVTRHGFPYLYGVKTWLFIGFSFLLPFSGISQGEFNNWYFGSFAGVTFNFGAPQALMDGQMGANRGSITVSDSLGNLLFYSNGEKVWNRNHQVMPNGNNLIGRMDGVPIPPTGDCTIP